MAGLGYWDARPEDTTPRWLLCPPLSQGSGCSPTNGSPSPPLSGYLAFQFPVPPSQAPLNYSLLLFVCLSQLCLPRVPQTVSGSYLHPTARLGALKSLQEN